MNTKALLSDNKKLNLLTVASAGVTALAVFLPWATLKHPVLSQSINGIDTGDGLFVLLLGAAAGVCAFLFRQGKVQKRGVLLAAMICFAVAALISVVDLFRIDQHTNTTAALGIEFSRGIGIFLVVAATLAGTASALFAWRGSK